MKLALVALGLFALAHMAPAATAPAYQLPSCHGIAAVPGYENCRP